ncbi:hypothetical protein [Streptomyces sp. I6]|uniref:hypothetical protein n=1 Tax=Streptomyces sp. I6 TaxID=2483113 RepID=UPI0028803173|nr:hypothetical protein [Streptomyces sp. I6]
MPRPPDLAKRRQLLERIHDYVIRNGLSGLSLRPSPRNWGRATACSSTTSAPRNA